MNSSDELLAVFKDEVQELLDVLITAIEKDPAEWNLQVLFRTCHNIKGAARMVDAVAVREAAHALEDLFDSFRNGVPITDELAALTKEGYLLLETCFELDEENEIPDIGTYREVVAEFIEATGRPEGAKKAAQPDKKKKVRPQENRKNPEKPVHQRVETTQPDSEAGTPEASPGTIRIAIDKLDYLTGFATDIVNFVNRAHLHRAMSAGLLNSVTDLENGIGINKHPAVQQIKDNNRKLYGSIVKGGTHLQSMSEEFKDALRSLRMVRIDSAATLLKKVVRESARATGHQVDFEIIGGDTEIDRTMLDVLRDPLIHLIRNAIGHGIESQRDRRKAGKNPKGTVTLKAASRGPWVEITISDDGRGIDVEKIRASARQKKIVTGDELASMTDAEAADLIFAPGFTTMQSVTELSGRGVGLDVVRKNLASISGRATVDWSPGVGTSFKLRVPLTRLTTKGMLFRIGTHLFTLPSSNLESAIRVVTSEIVTAEGGDFVMIDGELIPLVDLERLLEVRSDREPARPALVLSDDTKRAFLVDEIIGEIEFVIRELSWNLKQLPGIAGSTVIEGNRIALVLNTEELLGLNTGQTSYTRRETADNEIRRKRILIVDDSVTSRTLVKNILTTAGYDTVATVDGEQGWDELVSSNYDLVVSDIEMPRLDGIDLTKRIRAEAKLEKLPVILVTSLANEEHKTAGAEAGADSYIVKGTFDQDELLSAVERLL